MGGSAYHNRRQSQPIAAAMTTSFVLAAVSPNPQYLSPAKEPLADCNIAQLQNKYDQAFKDQKLREA